MSSKQVIFHRGSTKLELDKRQLNNGLEFPEDADIKMNEKKASELYKRFVEDVTSFEEKVNESTRSYYEESTMKIVNFLRAPKTDFVPISVFLENDTSSTIRTALVQCNFTDISRFINGLNEKLGKVEENEEEEENNEEEEEENEEIRGIVITENNAIHTIIDSISNIPPSIGCALIVQQFESLRPQTLDSIVSLIYNTPSIRSRIHNLYLVVCISTSCTFFTTTCSIDTLNLLELQQFQFTRLDAIFENIITTNIRPAIFSGKFLDYLQTRYFSCDYSVSSLIKAVQFAFLQKYISDPFWRDECESNSDDLEKYARMCRFFRKEVLRNEIDAGKLHIEIQSNEDFWKQMEGSIDFKQWKQFTFESKSNQPLFSFIEKLKRLNLDESIEVKLDKLLEKFERLLETSEDSSPTKSMTPSKKMSANEFRQKQQAEHAARQNNPVKTSKNVIATFVIDLFKSTLQPYPSEWRNVIGLENSSKDDLCQTSLDANDEFDIEQALLENPKYKGKAISVAWRTLLTHRNFKSVPLPDWANEFIKKYKTHPKTRKEAFYGAAGQLEYMGLIRGGADKQTTSINILYHPISHIAHI